MSQVDLEIKIIPDVVILPVAALGLPLMILLGCRRLVAVAGRRRGGGRVPLPHQRGVLPHPPCGGHGLRRRQARALHGRLSGRRGRPGAVHRVSQRCGGRRDPDRRPPRATPRRPSPSGRSWPPAPSSRCSSAAHSSTPIWGSSSRTADGGLCAVVSRPRRQRHRRAAIITLPFSRACRASLAVVEARRAAIAGSTGSNVSHGRWRVSRQHGSTLLELVTILAISAVLCAIAVPGVASGAQRLRRRRRRGQAGARPARCAGARPGARRRPSACPSPATAPTPCATSDAPGERARWPAVNSAPTWTATTRRAPSSSAPPAGRRLPGGTSPRAGHFTIGRRRQGAWSSSSWGGACDAPERLVAAGSRSSRRVIAVAILGLACVAVSGVLGASLARRTLAGAARVTSRPCSPPRASAWRRCRTTRAPTAADARRRAPASLLGEVFPHASPACNTPEAFYADGSGTAPAGTFVSDAPRRRPHRAPRGALRGRVAGGTGARRPRSPCRGGPSGRTRFHRRACSRSSCERRGAGSWPSGTSSSAARAARRSRPRSLCWRGVTVSREVRETQAFESHASAVPGGCARARASRSSNCSSRRASRPWPWPAPGRGCGTPAASADGAAGRAQAATAAAFAVRSIADELGLATTLSCPPAGMSPDRALCMEHRHDGVAAETVLMAWDPARRVLWRKTPSSYLADHVERFAVDYFRADGRRLGPADFATTGWPQTVARIVVTVDVTVGRAHGAGQPDRGAVRRRRRESRGVAAWLRTSGGAGGHRLGGRVRRGGRGGRERPAERRRSGRRRRARAGGGSASARPRLSRAEAPSSSAHRRAVELGGLHRRNLHGGRAGSRPTQESACHGRPLPSEVEGSCGAARRTVSAVLQLRAEPVPQGVVAAGDVELRAPLRVTGQWRCTAAVVCAAGSGWSSEAADAAPRDGVHGDVWPLAGVHALGGVWAAGEEIHAHARGEPGVSARHRHATRATRRVAASSRRRTRPTWSPCATLRVAPGAALQDGVLDLARLPLSRAAQRAGPVPEATGTSWWSRPPRMRTLLVVGARPLGACPVVAGRSGRRGTGGAGYADGVRRRPAGDAAACASADRRLYVGHLYARDLLVSAALSLELAGDWRMRPLAGLVSPVLVVARWALSEGNRGADAKRVYCAGVL